MREDGSLYLGAEYIFLIKTAGTERLRISSDGKVGIGTTSPTEILEVNGWIGRSAHNNGALCGSYNNIGPNGSKSNPIYTIGWNYKPNDADLNNMYGIGFTDGAASFITGTASGWGLYVAADGDARTFLSGKSSGISYILKNGGKLGIGTDSPTDTLHISSANTSSSGQGAVGHIKLTNTTTANSARIRVGYKLTYSETAGDYPGNVSQEFAIFETDAQEEAGYMAVNGNTTAIGNAGDNYTLRWYDEDGHPGSWWVISASGSISSSSDIRLKQNIRYFDDLYDISSGMQKFKDISFCKWNKISLSGKECNCDHYGIIAQEFETLFPEFIETQYGGTDPSYNDMKSFKRSAFTTYSLFILQNVIKQNDEEKTKLVAAEEKIAALEAENITLKNRLDAIEARLAAGGL